MTNPTNPTNTYTVPSVSITTRTPVLKRIRDGSITEVAYDPKTARLIG